VLKFTDAKNRAVETCQLDIHGQLRQPADCLQGPFPDLRIRLADVFNFPLEPHEQPPKVREPPPKYRAG